MRVNFYYLYIFYENRNKYIFIYEEGFMNSDKQRRSFKNDIKGEIPGF